MQYCPQIEGQALTTDGLNNSARSPSPRHKWGLVNRTQLRSTDMARASNTANGSTLYQVQLSVVVSILESPVAIDGAVRDTLLRFLTKRKSTMSFTKAALVLDDLTGLDVSERVEAFEDEKAGAAIITDEEE